MRVILVNPLIPQNTGSIGRLCAAMDEELVLIEPLGFSLEDRYLKRAGLDYWPWIKLRIFPSWSAALSTLDGRFWLFSSHAQRSYSEIHYQAGDNLVFGCETDGLPQEVLETLPIEEQLHIPMVNPKVRSINLAQCAAIGLTEAKRQVGFPLHRSGSGAPTGGGRPTR